MKKIFITGCSGYIGSHLCKMLSGKYEIHGLDIIDPQVKIDQFFNVDITKQFVGNETIYDAVIHLAALVNVGESESRPINYYITNINGTMNVINKIKTKNFVLASTGAAISCESAYGRSKRAAEDVTRSYSAMANIDYTIFRFYNVIGSSGFNPTNPDGLFSKLLQAKTSGEFTILGDDYDTVDGTCERDYVHVDEICSALELAIEKPSNSVECLGHGVGYTVKQMVDIYKRVNNCEFDVKIGPRRKGDMDSSVLQNVSPYMQTSYSIEDLLKS